MNSDYSVKFQSENQLLYLLSAYRIQWGIWPSPSLESFHFSTPSIQRAPHTCFEWVRPRRHSPKSAINHVMGNRIAWFCIAGGRLKYKFNSSGEKNMYFRQISTKSFKGSMYELPMALQFPTYFQSLAKDRKPIARPSPAHQVVKMILLISEEFLVLSCGMRRFVLE